MNLIKDLLEIVGVIATFIISCIWVILIPCLVAYAIYINFIKLL